MHTQIISRSGLAILILALAALLPVGGLFARGSGEAADNLRVVLYIPSRLVGSAQAAMLTTGLQEARGRERKALVTIRNGHAGAQRQELDELMRGGQFDLIVTSGQSNAALCANLLPRYASRRCLVFDAYLPGVVGLHTLLFNRREQAFLAGYLAGRLVVSDITNADPAGGQPQPRAGLIADATTDMDALADYIALGLSSVNTNIALERYINRLSPDDDGLDASLSAALATLEGAQVIIVATQAHNDALRGAARRAGSKLILLDSLLVRRYPVVAAITPRFALAAHQKLEAALNGHLQYGRASIVSARDDFLEYSARSLRGAPQLIRREIAALRARLINGELRLRALL